MKKKIMIAAAIFVLSVFGNVEAMRTPAGQNADLGFVKVPFESLRAPFRSVLMPTMDAESRARAVGIPDASRVVVKRNMPDFITKPIAEWPSTGRLSSEEKREYDKTWNYEKNLKKNQEDLVSMFIDTCCDFSFKTVGDSSKRILLGKTDSAEKIAICTDAPASDDLISLPIQASAVGLSCTKVYSVDDDLRRRIEDYFTLLSKNPIGCKLMRIAIAKFRAHKRNKLIFIPTDNDSNFSFLISKYLGHAMGEIYPDLKPEIDPYINDTHYSVMAIDRGTGRCWREMRPLPKKSDFIILPHDETKWHLLVDLIKYDESKGTFNVERGEFPIETILFHEFLHAIHDIDGKFPTVSNRVIKQRYSSFGGMVVPELGVHIRPEEVQRIWQFWHTNDEEYATVYGLGISGFCPVNESMYLSSKYGVIRGRHREGALLSGSINFEDNGRGLIKTLIEHGDIDLYRTYLDPAYQKNPNFKFPRFGVGQYQCSDYDPETGEKLVSKAEEKMESKTVTAPDTKKPRLEKREEKK